jgi:hypothetical protein
MSKLQKKPAAHIRGHPTLQNMNFFYFCGSFLLSWIRIRIPNTDPDPLARLNTDPIRIRIRNPGLCGLTFPQGRIRREKKTKRKKENVLNQNSLGSASRKASTEIRKTKKTFFCFLRTDLPPGWITQREERLRKIFLCFHTKKVFLSLSSLR